MKKLAKAKFEKADKLMNETLITTYTDIEHIIHELNGLSNKIEYINNYKDEDNQSEDAEIHDNSDNKEEESKKDNLKVGMQTIAGKDRSATSVQISKNTFQKSNGVILVNGNKSSDALTAGPLAKSLDVPIMFINESNIPDDVKAEINRLQAKDVILIGGKNCISQEIENKDLKSYNVSRIAGKDRYETSYLVAQRVFKTNKGKKSLIIVNGENSIDALSASNLNDSLYGPILLTNSHSLSQEARKYIRNSEVERITILGGEMRISKDIEDELDDLDVEYDRIAGKDRYETSLLIAQTNIKNNELVVTSGVNYEDALSVSPYTIKKNANLLLVNETEGLDGINKHIKNIKPNKVTIIGGYKSISNSVKKNLKKTLLKIK